MAKCLISFPSAAMVAPQGERGVVSRESHAVIDEAKAAGVYVLGGGIDESVPPLNVSGDGAVAEGGNPPGASAKPIIGAPHEHSAEESQLPTLRRSA